jgi:hypothetical protein
MALRRPREDAGDAQVVRDGPGEKPGEERVLLGVPHQGRVAHALRRIGGDVGTDYCDDGGDQPDPAKRSHLEAQHVSLQHRELRVIAAHRRSEVADVASWPRRA